MCLQIFPTVLEHLNISVQICLLYVFLLADKSSNLNNTWGKKVDLYRDCVSWEERGNSRQREKAWTSTPRRQREGLSTYIFYRFFTVSMEHSDIVLQLTASIVNSYHTLHVKTRIPTFSRILRVINKQKCLLSSSVMIFSYLRFLHFIIPCISRRHNLSGANCCFRSSANHSIPCTMPKC